MGTVISVAGFIAVVFLFGMMEDYGDEQRKRECIQASIDNTVAICSSESHSGGEDW